MQACLQRAAAAPCDCNDMRCRRSPVARQAQQQHRSRQVVHGRGQTPLTGPCIAERAPRKHEASKAMPPSTQHPSGGDAWGSPAGGHAYDRAGGHHVKLSHRQATGRHCSGRPAAAEECPLRATPGADASFRASRRASSARGSRSCHGRWRALNAGLLCACVCVRTCAEFHAHARS